MDTNTTSTVSPQAVSPNTVPWPSLYLALVAFAINSMTQPAGMVCGADADVGFLLKSSPIMCILDASLAFCELLYTYFTTPWAERSCQIAHTDVIRRRFHSEIYKGLKHAKLAGFQVNRTNEQAFRVLAFLLNVSQFIKLLGYGGLIWTKVIAALYLGSFLFIELLVVWPVANMKEIEDAEKNPSAVKEHTSIALAVVFMLYFASSAFRDIAGQSDHTLLYWSGIGILGLGSILAVPAMVYANKHQEADTRREVKHSWIFLPFVLGIPASLIVAGRYVPEHTPAIVLEVVCAVVSGVWGAIALLYANKTTRVGRQDGKEDQRKKVEQVSAWYFFVLQIVTGLLYYKFSYDPTGTSRPGWTEWLG